MVKVVVQHHVADYDAWYPVFTEHEAFRRKHGGSGHILLRSREDPNSILIVTDFATAEGAQAFMADPSLPEAMAKAGVDSEPKVQVFDEAESKAYG